MLSGISKTAPDLNCPLCGNAYPCAHSRGNAGQPRNPGTLIPRTSSPRIETARSILMAPLQWKNPLRTLRRELWRDQVASARNSTWARRKGADRDPNMELRFPCRKRRLIHV